MALIVKREDVTEDILNEVWSAVEGWYMDSPIDWEDVFRRTEQYSELDFGTSWDSPAIRYIQRTMRQWKSEC